MQKRERDKKKKEKKNSNECDVNERKTEGLPEIKYNEAFSTTAIIPPTHRPALLSITGNTGM